MSDRRWRPADVQLADRFERDGLVYRVVGLITDPVVVIVPADERDGDDLEHYVIGSSQFAEFRKLVRTEPA